VAKTQTFGVSHTDSPMQVIGGKIHLLTKAEGRLNLLAGIQQKAGLAGAALALGGQAGLAANAVSLALYDGEDVEHCGFALGEQAVVGTFENTFFEDGDDVKVVASRLESGVMFAHAVVRVSDGALWMPYNIDRGRVAMMKSTAKMGGVGVVAGCIVLSLMFYFQGGVTVMLGLLPGLLATLVGMTTFVGAWVYHDSRHQALYAEQIFKVLGFKNPKIVSLSPFSLTKESGYRMNRGHYVFRLRKALAAYGSLSKAPAAKASPKATVTPAPRSARPAAEK
jgi:hypothetical protein